VARPAIEPHGSQRLRLGRRTVGQAVYHLRFTTNQRRCLLADFQTARLVARSLAAVVDMGRATSLCHVVMPDHVHWLIQLHADGLADVARPAKSLSAMAINRHLGRHGPVWQTAYFDRMVRPSESLLGVARYILRNPVRAGLVRRVGQWPHWDAIWL
jgi:REP element-mobilizing transposase RayT